MAALVATALLFAVPAASALAPGSVSGLLVRVQGDVAVGESESADLVVVVSGDAEIAGRAGTVVVIGGTARLADALVGRLVVVRGSAVLGGSSAVLGDLWLVGAGLEQAPGTTVGGAVRSGFGSPGWRWLVEEPVLAAGVLGLVVLAGWLAVAVGAGTMQGAAGSLTSDPAGSLGAALLLFLLGPAAAVLLFFTVVGLPVSLVYLAVALPALGLLGFAVTALRLGEWLLRSAAARPFPAVVLGTVVLAVVALIPYVGQVLVPLAAALGGGALARNVRRAGRGEAGSEPAVGGA